MQAEGAAVQGSYVFNRVFDDSYSQQDIYESSAKRYVADFLGGSNVTIFAYGQTGSGKTYTMMGSEAGVRECYESLMVYVGVHDAQCCHRPPARWC